MKLEMQATSKKEALEELVDVLAQTGKVSNPQELAEELLEQENKVSTGIGEGIAIPHKMISGLKRTIMAFGRKKDGLPFDAIDHQPVSLLFLILGPQGKPHRHLQLLSRLSRLLHDPELKNVLLEAQTPNEILNALRDKEAE
jgi:mannitol/fructose-specific phosphotransferase system IIA component (Ntr-type)